MTPTEETTGTDWEAFMENANEEFLEAFERNVEAQAEFVETWMQTIEESTDEERTREALEGYTKAYQAWMDAAEEQVDRLGASIDGEDVSLEAFRDSWLDAANQAFKEVMGTSAFAAATGDTVETAMDFKEQADERAEETLHALGFATVGDVEEVGERLLEVERRQQDIEERLDEILAELRA